MHRRAITPKLSTAELGAQRAEYLPARRRPEQFFRVPAGPNSERNTPHHPEPRRVYRVGVPANSSDVLRVGSFGDFRENSVASKNLR